MTKHLRFVALTILVIACGWNIEAAPANGDLDIARRLENAFVKVADEASRSVVVIKTARIIGRSVEAEEGTVPDSEQFRGTPFEFFFRQNPPGPPRDIEGEGSGIVLRANGYILTNHHVVDQADKITVRFQDGRELPAKLIGSDERTDLAVIKVEAEQLPVARLGDSDQLRVGQWAIAIGAPFELAYSFTVGFVSAKGRSAILSRGGSAYEDYIQTDASINPGNSGGPLCDIEGQVIGINTLIRGLNRGIGFAIPINMARSVAEQLIDSGRVLRPWLGIVIEPLADNDDLQKLVGAESGVVVREIRPGTPAATSDLRPADIIVAVDGVPVENPRELQQQVLSKKIGQSLDLQVLRDGKKETVAIVTAEMEDALAASSVTPTVEPDTATAFGMTVQTMTSALAEKFELKETPGVIVTAVEPTSVAASKQIRPGLVITEVNRTPIQNATEFKAAMAKADTAQGVLFYLKRGDNASFVVLKDR